MDEEQPEVCSCGEPLPHDWINNEYMTCIPPEHQLRFGSFTLDAGYKAALYAHAAYYVTEEVMGSYLGHNPNFPSEEDWLAGGDACDNCSNNDNDNEYYM